MLAGMALTSPFVHGQDCSLTVRGRVIDDHDRSPLAFAEIGIVGTGKGSVADEQGYFAVEGLCPGSHRIRVEHLGCTPVERTIELKESVVIDFLLEHHTEELREMEVVTTRPDENVGQPIQRIDRRAMERGSGRTLTEMLATIPGVTTLNSGPTISKPVIHGLSGNRVLILNQGIRQEDQQWGTEHAPNLDPFSSDRLTVVRGAASVQYGSDALGGVVITEPLVLPKEAGIGGEVRGVGMLNGRGGGANAMLHGGVKGLHGVGWRIQGSGRYLGDSEAPDYVLSNTGVNELGLSTSLGYRDHKGHASVYYSWFGRETGILRASHIGNLTDLNNAISSGEPWYIGDFTYEIVPPRQSVQHHLVKAEAGRSISERGRLVLTYGYQSDDRREYDIRRGGRSDTPALDLNLSTQSADAVFKHWIGRHLHGRVGVSGLLQENVNVPGTGIRPLIPNYEKRSAGIFVVEHLPLTDHVELEGGARLESTRLNVFKYDVNDVLLSPEHEFTNNALSLGANWTVSDSVRLRFNASSAYRPPHVSELYSEGLHHGAAAIELGDAELAPERSYKATADLEASWLNGRLRTDVTLYADLIEDYIYLRPDGVELTVRGAFPVFNYTATDALLHGLDAMLHFHVTPRWSLRSRMSIVRGRDDLQQEWLLQMPSDRMLNELLYKMTDAGRWTAIEIGASSTVVFEQTRIPEGVDFALPPGTYQLMGLQAAATHPLGKGELRFGLQASNLLNMAYRDYMDRFRYYADARGIDLVIWIRYGFGKQ